MPCVTRPSPQRTKEPFFAVVVRGPVRLIIVDCNRALSIKQPYFKHGISRWFGKGLCNISEIHSYSKIRHSVVASPVIPFGLFSLMARLRIACCADDILQDAWELRDSSSHCFDSGLRIHHKIQIHLGDRMLRAK